MDEWKQDNKRLGRFFFTRLTAWQVWEVYNEGKDHSATLPEPPK